METPVINVYATAMNRTALGIVDAFMILYPEYSFLQLKAILKDDINPTGPVQVKTLFHPYNKDRLLGVIQPASIKKEYEDAGLNLGNSFFTGIEETFRSKDGVAFYVTRLWESKDHLTGRSDIEKLIAVAREYGICVTDQKPENPFKSFIYYLEIVNQKRYDQLTNPNKLKNWILIASITLLLTVLLLLIIL